MNYWIFQGTPRRFRVEDYVHEHNRIEWTVRQHVDDVTPGDTVFIWRAKGSMRLSMTSPRRPS